jgi:hypothetical protein
MNASEATLFPIIQKTIERLVFLEKYEIINFELDIKRSTVFFPCIEEGSLGLCQILEISFINCGIDDEVF